MLVVTMSVLVGNLATTNGIDPNALLSKKLSMSSDLSIDYDGEAALFDEECKMFMNSYVEQVFHPDSVISQECKGRKRSQCSISRVYIKISDFSSF